MYRYDPDLEFLKDVPSKYLEPLVEILTKDPKDGNPHVTEMLTQSAEYQAHHPDHHQYWRPIAGEFQLFGANTFASAARGGEGVRYREILIDICDKQKVNYNKKSSVPHLEESLMYKMLHDGMMKIPEGDLKAFCEELGIKTTSYTHEAVLAAVRTAIRRGKFTTYKLAVIVANAVWKILFGRGLAFAANAALTRTIGIIAGPIGLAVNAVWLAKSIAGPAYRVTVPATLIIALLRQALNEGKLGNGKKKKKKGKKKKSTKTNGE